MIIAMPLYGLCNRMRLMTSLIEVSNHLGKKPIFLWINNGDCAINFGDLFIEFPYRVININHFISRVLYKLLTKLHFCTIITDDYIREFFRERYDQNKDKLKKHRNLFFYGCDNINNTEDFSCFKANPSITEKCIVKSGDNIIGIHIRRTDNQESILHSPTEEFVKAIKREIENNCNVKFYLATDDKKEEKYFVNKFKDRIIIYEKRSYSRNDSIAIEDALIDLYNLKNCKKIYASYYSSFSQVAAYWGKIEREEIYV